MLKYINLPYVVNSSPEGLSYSIEMNMIFRQVAESKNHLFQICLLVRSSDIR